jgi:predicted RNA-binding Zn ribbon-like protein
VHSPKRKAQYNYDVLLILGKHAVTESQMQIDTKLLVQRTSNVKVIEGWICGTLARGAGPAHPALLAAQATRPWLTEVTSIDEERALVAFVGLNPDDPHETGTFIKDFGLFGNADVASIAGHPSAVRAFWKEANKSGLTPFATDIASVRQMQARVSAISKFALVVNNRERNPAFQEFLKINAGLGEHMRRSHGRHFTQQLLSYYVSQGLASVALGIAPHKKKMVAIALAPDVCSVLYVALLLQLIRGTRFKVCRRATCGKLFVVTRSGKQYCGVYCQNLAKVNRYRRRKRRLKLKS